MSGDSRIDITARTARGAQRITDVESIDAHSVESGDFTEARTMPNGDKVWLTPNGAAAYDEWRRTYDASDPATSEFKIGARKDGITEVWGRGELDETEGNPTPRR